MVCQRWYSAREDTHWFSLSMNLSSYLTIFSCCRPRKILTSATICLRSLSVILSNCSSFLAKIWPSLILFTLRISPNVPDPMTSSGSSYGQRKSEIESVDIHRPPSFPLLNELKLTSIKLRGGRILLRLARRHGSNDSNDEMECLWVEVMSCWRLEIEERQTCNLVIRCPEVYKRSHASPLKSG